MDHRRRLSLFLLAALLAVRNSAAQDYGSSLGGKQDPYRPQAAPMTGVPPAPAYGGAPAPYANPPVQTYPGPPAAGPAVPAAAPQYAPPGPPVTPQFAPQGPPAVAPNFPPPPPQNIPAAVPAAQLFEPAKIIAVVGDQYILAGDVLPMVEQILEPYYAKVKNAGEREQVDAQRDILAKQMLRQLIDSKLMYLEFERTVPKDKLSEVQKKVKLSFDREFAEAREKVAAAAKPEDLQEMIRKDPILMRMAVAMKENGLETLAELDQHLRKHHSSLDKQLRMYGEHRLGRSSMSKHINYKPEITHEAIEEYFLQHAADFDLPAKSKWEAIMIRKDSFPDRTAAFNATAALGNEIFFGAPFEAVAKRSSQGLNAADGGKHDWTQQGSLASETVDQAIFSLPVGKLSQILEDPKAFYIIRVTERQEAGRIPFLEAQEKVREKIKQQKIEKQYKEFVELLRKKTPVWSVYDKDQKVDPNGELASERQPRRK